MRKKLIEIKSGVIGTAAGIVLGIVLLITGCGADEPQASEERVIEKLDENGDVIGTAVEDEDASGDTAASEDTGASADREIESISPEKDYLEYMTDDELRTLAVEALSAAGKDTSPADGTCKTYGLTFELPEGFAASEDTENMYVTDRYPIDASNVVYEELKPEYTLQLMTEEDFADMIEASFRDTYDEEVEVDITEFKELKIDGVPAFRIKDEYDLEGNHMTQLMYVINGSKTYCLIYTGTSDYDRMELFETSAATISVRK